MTVLGRMTVVGAGGHGKVVVSTSQAAGYYVCRVVDDDVRKVGGSLLGVPIASTIGELEVKATTLAVIAVGDNLLRRQLVERLRGLAWVTVVHPHTSVHDSVSLGEGSVVFAGAVIQPDVAIGRHCIVNTGATIDHDCMIGDFAHVGPGAHLSGNTTLSEGVFLGAGSATIPGVTIGCWTTVGAGGVVIGDLPDGVIALGVPARHRE